MMSERESEDSIHIIAFFILEIGILSLELYAWYKDMVFKEGIIQQSQLRPGN